MKLPDSMPMESGSFLTIKEPWRTEWEIGVQVSYVVVTLEMDSHADSSLNSMNSDSAPMFYKVMKCAGHEVCWSRKQLARSDWGFPAQCRIPLYRSMHA